MSSARASPTTAMVARSLISRQKLATRCSLPMMSTSSRPLSARPSRPRRREVTRNVLRPPLLRQPTMHVVASPRRFTLDLTSRWPLGFWARQARYCLESDELYTDTAEPLAGATRRTCAEVHNRRQEYRGIECMNYGTEVQFKWRCMI